MIFVIHKKVIEVIKVICTEPHKKWKCSVLKITPKIPRLNWLFFFQFYRFNRRKFTRIYRMCTTKKYIVFYNCLHSIPVCQWPAPVGYCARYCSATKTPCSGTGKRAAAGPWSGGAHPAASSSTGWWTWCRQTTIRSADTTWSACGRPCSKKESYRTVSPKASHQKNFQKIINRFTSSTPKSTYLSIWLKKKIIY